MGDGFLRHPVTKAANLFSGRCYRCVHLVQIVGCRFHLSAGALDQRGKLSTVCIRQRLAVIPCTTIQHLLIMCGVLFLLPCSLILVAVHGVQVLHKVQRILCCLGVCRSSPLHPAGEILVRPVSKGLLPGGCTDGLHPCIQCVHGVDVHVHLRLPALVFQTDYFAFLSRCKAGSLRRCRRPCTGSADDLRLLLLALTSCVSIQLADNRILCSGHINLAYLSERPLQLFCL